MHRAIFLSLVLLGACARPAATPVVEVRGAWARPADSAGTTAAYFVLLNRDTTPVTLAGEFSPLAEFVGLHETREMNGMVRMMAIDSALSVAAGDSLVLQPSGKHLMVMGLRRTLVVGDSLPLVLNFRDGRVLNATAMVRAP